MRLSNTYFSTLPYSLQHIAIHVLILLDVVSADYLSMPCPCVHFNTSGTFHSPDYPRPMGEIRCLLYHFYAPSNHLVKLRFDSLVLPPPDQKCTSFLRVFTSSATGEISSNEPADKELCGSAELQTIYSKDNHLILHIRNLELTKGFTGTYSFLSKKLFSPDAVEVSECSYRVEKMKGKIYSPAYPYAFPASVNCSFFFPQRRGYSLVVSSSDVQIEGDARLEAYETAPKKVRVSLLQRTGSFYVTSASSLLVHFSAGENKKKRTGFAIDFAYEESAWRIEPAATKETAAECALTISSSSGRRGELHSNQLGRPSNQPSRCTVTFQGGADEKVSVRFTHFHLYEQDRANNTTRCSEQDHVSAAVRVGSRLSAIDEWCGRDTPPQLMSSSSLLQLEYTIKSPRALRESSPDHIGWKVEYEFHQDWLMHKMQAEWQRSKGCRFEFNSSVHTSGKLWSVNHPGLYPRELYCEYTFHGADNQIVHIHFEYFDVEGFNQCDETTQSDYVLFSNYQTHDRTNRRFCGKVAPRGPILSESNYFRMIFSTNDIFDATGFYAHYQFISQPTAQISRVKLTPISSSHIHTFSLAILLSFILFC